MFRKAISRVAILTAVTIPVEEKEMGEHLCLVCSRILNDQPSTFFFPNGKSESVHVRQTGRVQAWKGRREINIALFVPDMTFDLQWSRAWGREFFNRLKGYVYLGGRGERNRLSRQFFSLGCVGCRRSTRS